MYSREFWDNIYNNHFHDAPWMDDSWKTPVMDRIASDMSRWLGKEPNGRYLLDYGCGNGHMGVYFLKHQMRVDLADISSVLVKRLHAEFDGKPGVRVYRTDTPLDLPKSRKYDVIIAWNLFHHLDPSTWHDFLAGFMAKMKVGSLLLISGWDADDSIIKEDHNTAKYTQNATWFVNDLPEHIGDLPCEMLYNDKLVEPVPVFTKSRIFRYFIIRKTRKNKQNNSKQ